LAGFILLNSKHDLDSLESRAKPFLPLFNAEITNKPTFLNCPAKNASLMGMSSLGEGVVPTAAERGFLPKCEFIDLVFPEMGG
jgi:hypothetical protein